MHDTRVTFKTRVHIILSHSRAKINLKNHKNKKKTARTTPPPPVTGKLSSVRLFFVLLARVLQNKAYLLFIRHKIRIFFLLLKELNKN